MKSRRKIRSPQFPEITAGEWRGEILPGASVNFGQVVQPGSPRQSVEFTYILAAVILIMPSAAFGWPGAMIIVAPTPMKAEFPDAGILLKTKELPSLMLTLHVTRAQFSDVLRFWEAGTAQGNSF
jgi:hypothetical protein